jgi:Asp-tRNA(Asn)/Glu-tRNA(Gln) amidotransferase A subunit family amidase
MLKMRVALLLLAATSPLVLATQQQRTAGSGRFQIEETTIAEIHAAMKSGRLTCRALVDQYLRRIDALDKKGPAINAIVQINSEAGREADDLDRRYKTSGPVGPLHCIPTIVKDNFETRGLQSAAGSLALKGFVSTRDAFQVRRLKQAGAIVLAKSNMAEWAFTPYETVSSILPGYTRNPYALDRVTAGSSGGTAAAVAANYATVGVGSDTGNSIRGPASHQSLVGIRSTMGLTSRAGVVPLSLLADIAGPMTRTVEDAVAVFQVIAGEDPDDAVTTGDPVLAAFRPADRPNSIPTYSTSLVRDGLKGTRIGVLRQAYERDTTDSDIVQVFMKALDDMRRAGAVIVDPAPVPLDSIKRAPDAAPCGGFKYDINRYLAFHGDRIPVKSLQDIIRSRQFHPTVQRRLEQAQEGQENGPDTPACRAEAEYRQQVRKAVTAVMDSLQLAAFVYPTWSNVPRLIGDLNTPHGDNSQFFSPTTGFPAIQVPMGYTRNGTLPAGVTFFGRAWDEATLIKLAYSYEQHTKHRRPPATAHLTK